jgi:hypothetical protein
VFRDEPRLSAVLSPIVMLALVIALVATDDPGRSRP